MCSFKSEDYSQPKCVKTVYRSGKKPNKSKIKKQSEEENIIKIISSTFELKRKQSN